jgi:hypothetical protein
LEKVQEKAVKMVTGLKGETYEEKFNELSLEIMKERWAQQDLMLTHKLFVGVLQTTCLEGQTNQTR